jgi:type II secretion system protein H
MPRSPHIELRSSPGRAFTLIELVLVMALLAIMAALVAPRMVSFFRGRVLSLEARRVLALTHYAQNRAIAEGVPVEVWFDPAHSTYGQNIAAGFAATDDHATSFALESSLTIETPAAGTAPVSELGDERMGMPPGQAVILFSPDGFFDFASVAKLVIRQGTEGALELVPTTDRLGYEILPYAAN